MKKLTLASGWCIALLLCSAGASAQLYKWVDDKGVTHFSDKAPPVNAKVAPVKAAASAAPPVPLPFELAEAVRKHPVTLYTGKECGACDQARSFLKGRGIPFAEKTISNQADVAKLKEVSGTGGTLPVMTVGRSKQVAFESEAWGGSLAAAGYPATRMLPPNYQYPAPVAAAPVAAPAAAVDPQVAAAAEEERRKRNLPPPPPDGFKF